MKVTDLVKIWDLLHVKDTGEIGFCDLEKAVMDVVGVEDDIQALREQPKCASDQ